MTAQSAPLGDSLAALRTEAQMSNLASLHSSSENLHSNLTLLRKQIHENTKAKEIFMNKKLYSVLMRIYNQTKVQAQQNEKGVAGCLEKIDAYLLALTGIPRKRSFSVVSQSPSDDGLNEQFASSAAAKRRKPLSESGGEFSAPFSPAGSVPLSVVGEFQPDEEVAARVSPKRQPSIWILAKIVRPVLQTNNTIKYEVVDEDAGEEEENAVKRKYFLPRDQIIRLSDNGLQFAKGNHVHAVYPATTTFYSAVVMQYQRKTKEYVLQFAEDEGMQRVSAKYVVAVPTDER